MKNTIFMHFPRFLDLMYNLSEEHGFSRSYPKIKLFGFPAIQFSDFFHRVNRDRKDIKPGSFIFRGFK